MVPPACPPADAAAAAPDVVFLFADIEGSTRLWEQQADAMAPALAQHDALARQAVADWQGQWVKGTGDGLHASFADAQQALGAVLQLQRALADAAAAGSLPLALRCGLHAGPAQARDNDWFGPAVNRAARIMSAAHGGQMLVSQTVADRLRPVLPAGVDLRSLGAVRLKDLDRPEPLWQVLAPPLRTDFPPLRSLEATPNNLAQQLNRFIGRETVLPELQALLGQHRLVTLLGTGGIGKSRLAVQLAAELLDAHPDGVWFIELAPVDDAQRLAQAVASVLGVQEEPGRPLDDTLRRHVASRRLLLVLDNCEHLVAGAAALAKGLLQAGAGVSLLATSRAPLQVAGEQVYPVPALGLPDPQRGGIASTSAATPEALLRHEAVRLFVDRARSADPAFALTSANAALVLEICQRLDGIALALELAAARVRSLPLPELARRLRDSLALLATRDTTVAPRQRTLQQLIDWSHDLLDADARVLYRRLAVFAGPWALDDAEAVCADPDLPADAVLDALDSLADQSLVAVLPAPDGSRRYRLLDTVRQHAAARLQAAGSEADATRRRHAQVQLALAEAAQQQLAGADKAAALDRLDQARDNLLAALAWCAQDQAAPGARAAAELGLSLGIVLRPYWLSRGLLSVWRDATLQMLAHPAAQCRDALRARALFNAGQVACFMGRYAEAMPQLSECLEIARDIGDTAREAAVLQPLGMAANGLGDRAAARRHAQDGVAVARALDDPRRLSSALNALAQLDRMEGRLQAAQRSYSEALALAQAQGDDDFTAAFELNLAMVSLASGDLRSARNGARNALRIVDRLGSHLLATSVLDVCTALAVALDDARHGARWHGAAEQGFTTAGMQRDAADAAFLAAFLEAGRRSIGALFDAEVERGRTEQHGAVWADLSNWLDSVSRSRHTDPAA
ncbi:ATP-binding protein [Pseudaquabacterium pictum]|uniref:Transcriptional regulator n=1 Tax=Pseudaquabacterium pictum TaxID=2315236 RepID=A0A480B2M2_9BURK|nr:adenylate/guanylate cyclase domain-containing protein [Rubrivivax pictus]GCL66145.1 transcriptional regulator [Rubrivivax pictus]